MFIENLLFNSLNAKETSLEDLAGGIFNRYNIEVSKQGIDNRFNDSSIKMAKDLLTKMLKHVNQSMSISNEFEHFRTIRVKDSTSFDLPENLAKEFPGLGGGASIAGIRIQYEFDLKGNHIIDMGVSPLAVNDYCNAWDTKENIQKGDLIIRDLGYSSIKMSKEIDNKEAYYLNRIKSDVAIYEKRGKEFLQLNLDEVELYMRKNGIEIMEKQVYLGHRVFIPTRMIIVLVPENKIDERIRKQKRKIHRRGAQISTKSLSRIGINLFATNCNEGILPLENVMKLYKIRWQIELVFKAWKSLGLIHLLKKAKAERVLTMLYFKLLWILMNMQIINRVSSYVFKFQKQKLSLYKAFKIIEKLKEKIWSLISDKGKLTQLLEQSFKYLIKKALCENRKYRMNSKEVILSFVK